MITVVQATGTIVLTRTAASPAMNVRPETAHMLKPTSHSDQGRWPANSRWTAAGMETGRVGTDAAISIAVAIWTATANAQEITAVTTRAAVTRPVAAIGSTVPITRRTTAG